VAGISRSSPRIASLLLQLRQATQSAQVWKSREDASLAGWIDQQSTDIERNLLIEDGFSGVEEFALQNALGSQFSYSGSAGGGLATIDDGSTPNAAASPWAPTYSSIPSSLHL
jgi:hypothetical protein